MAQVVSLWNSIKWNQAAFGGSGLDGLAGTSVSKLLYAALRKAGITLGPQRKPSPAQYQDAIEELNRLTGSLNCDRLFIFSIARAEYTLTSATSYTIGLSPDADFVAEPPQLLESAVIRSGQNVERQLEVITDPSRVSAYPAGGLASGLYNNRAYPVSTLYLTGAPQAGETLELGTWYRVPEFVSINDELLLPRQYEDALVLNLAVRLGPHFQRVIDPMLRADARESLMRLESINAPQPILELPWSCGCGGGWDGASIVISGGGSSGGSGTGEQGPPGPPGPAGPSGPPGPSANLAWSEPLSGAVNGVNAVFTLAHTPVGSITLYVNGVEQRPAIDYTLAGAQVTLAVAPKTGETILADYNY